MNILFAASEARPFVASGGLADVVGALPKALNGAGNECRVILPLYSDIPDKFREEMEKIAEFIKPLKHVTKIEVLPYHNYAGSKYESLGMPNTLPARMPTDEELAMATAILSNTK
jgi:glycogen synthase